MNSIKKSFQFLTGTILILFNLIYKTPKSCTLTKHIIQITEIHNSPNVSLLSYNREESMVFCLISALMWCTDRDYETFRELHSGKGSADLIYVPKRN